MPTEPTRCPWPGTDPLYIAYHDDEWGVPVHDDTTHFEFLVLEGAQAGLNWLTVLKRREGYRKAYKQFDVSKVARFSDDDVERLLNDAGVIRNRLKILSSIRNAKVFIEIQKEFGSFDTYVWGFVDNKPVVNEFKNDADIPASTALSDRVSKDLKERGMNFVGTTIIYAHLQATGIINDHVMSCFKHPSHARS